MKFLSLWIAVGINGLKFVQGRFVLFSFETQFAISARKVVVWAPNSSVTTLLQFSRTHMHSAIHASEKVSKLFEKYETEV